MTGPKPDLVIHAGFPKCATTALQQILFQNDAALAQALGRIWIGRGFTLGGPGAPVSEIMYQPDETRERIANLTFDAGQKYLLSSEALAQRPEMIAALAERFSISQIILTTRLPCLMALSDYCFSGWLSHPPAQAGLTGKTARLSETCANLATIAPLSVCPIEPANLGSRFLNLFSNTAPCDIDQQMAQLGAANPSTPPALAATLHTTLQEHLTSPVPGPLRSAFTHMAMINRGPPDFATVLPQDIHTVFQNTAQCAAELAQYDALLANHGVTKDLRQDAITTCQTKLNDLAQRPLPSADLSAAMRAHTEWFVKRIQKDRPETVPLFT